MTTRSTLCCGDTLDILRSRDYGAFTVPISAIKSGL